MWSRERPLFKKRAWLGEEPDPFKIILSKAGSNPASAPSADRAPAFMDAVNLVLELVVAHRADHHVLADNEARRAVDLQSVGHLHHFLDAGLRLGARHVLVQAIHVDAHLLGDG